MKRISKTNETTSFIIKFFHERGAYARRHGVASGSAEYTNKAGETKERYVHAGITGGSDIFVWLPGDFLGVEVKTGKDKLRPEQEGFIASLEKMGFECLVVKDIYDFLYQWNNYVIIKSWTQLQQSRTSS